MEELSATAVAQRFAAAVAASDEAAARGCAREWLGDRDGPARLYNQLAGQPVALEVVGPARSGTEGRAAQPMAITQHGQAVEQLTLVGDGAPFQITGVATSDAHLEGFLDGSVPAVLAWDQLTPDPEARAAAEALAKTVEAAAGGPPSVELSEAMSSGPGAIVTVGRLADASKSRGGHLEIVEARGLATTRARGDLGAPGDPGRRAGSHLPPTSTTRRRGARGRRTSPAPRCSRADAVIDRSLRWRAARSDI